MAIIPWWTQEIADFDKLSLYWYFFYEKSMCNSNVIHLKLQTDFFFIGLENIKSKGTVIVSIATHFSRHIVSDENFSYFKK